MGKHFAQVFVESKDGTVTVTIRCDSCEGGTFAIATAHLETLARILPRVAKAQGIDLDDAKTETILLPANTPEHRATATRIFDAFVRRRKAGDN